MIRAKDAGKYKQFRRGIQQLGNEAVIQIPCSYLRGNHAPVLAAVGPLQFDVVTGRWRPSSLTRSRPIGCPTRWLG